MSSPESSKRMQKKMVEVVKILMLNTQYKIFLRFLAHNIINSIHLIRSTLHRKEKSTYALIYTIPWIV